MADLLDTDFFRAQYDAVMEEKVTSPRRSASRKSSTSPRIRDEYEAFAERIRPMVCDTALLLNQAIRDGKRVLFEGAQGTMLDIDHGTYPFVTSSSASAGGACTGTGVPPTRIDGVIGVSKAYITRVGGGPFPTEALDGAGERIRQRGNEFGAVTGRPRRCGWFDVPLLRYTAAINGFDSIVVTKLDVLDEFEKIPVCVGYTDRRAGSRRHAADRARHREDRTRLRMPSRLEFPDLRHLLLRRSARAREGIPRVSREGAPAWRSAAFPPVPSATRRSSGQGRASRS